MNDLSNEPARDVPLYAYWGKASPQGHGPIDHPLVFHSLDVAAVGRVYLKRQPRLLSRLARWLGLSDNNALELLTFCFSVHDLGKFAENFQQKAADVFEVRFGSTRPTSSCPAHHDRISACFLKWAFVGKHLPRAMRHWDADLWRCLLTASFGHHGSPPASGDNDVALLLDAMFESSRVHALEFMDWCASFFPLIPGPQPDDKPAKLVSWWLAGATVLADWIGSNTNWFDYATAAERLLNLDEYWEQCALPRATKAVAESGVLNEPMLPFAGPESRLAHLRGHALRPAQRLAATVELPQTPQLMLLEDATGSGKTEAALILAARLIDAGLADGLFFGLPTQATADQMFERIDLNLPAWFAKPENATIVLTHGSRDQVHAFSSKLDRGNDEIRAEAETASLRVTQWMAQSNKRALLAQIGVGTIDQALLGLIRVKHQSLRMLGLFGKVLLVDEVHSYDPYMSKLLARTLCAHAASGGSAILLSATLSLAQRQVMLDAYAEGRALAASAATAPPATSRRRPAGSGSQHAVRAVSCAYPLLTRWHEGLTSADELPFDAAPESHRHLRIRYVSDESSILSAIKSALRHNRAIVWIRNTVADAMKAHELVRERFPDAKLTLFHARFALVDRQRIQNRVLESLGKESRSSARGPQIIITTQVLQESLDVDADEMISDLSFIDVLLQRFGRFRRHRRDAAGDPLAAGSKDPDGRGEGEIVVYGPDRERPPGENWYSSFSRGAAKVYPAYGKLWRTARVLGDAVSLPAAYRQLIEAVYGDEAEAIPESLQLAELRTDGEHTAQRIMAELGCIDLANGYCGDHWQNDERLGSRLGNSIEAVLLKREHGRWLPWSDDHDTDNWAMSGIRVPGWWVAEGAIRPVSSNPATAREIEDLRQEFRFLRHRWLIPLERTATGEWECVFEGEKPLRLIYCDRLGLSNEQGSHTGKE
jgi:CRISPR-associated endonuclease/helicase Cas3